MPKLKYCITFLLLTTLGLTAAAQEDCQLTIEEGNKLYQQGQIEKALEMVVPCTNAASESVQWQSYKFLAKAYLALGDKENARAMAVKMLELNPTYTPSPQTDPKEFIVLINSIDIVPKLSLGLTFIYGANLTLPRVINTYSPTNLTKTYSSQVGSQIGLVVGYNFSHSHALDINVIYNTKNYGIHYEWFGNRYKINESLSYFDFPIMYRYSLPSSNRFKFSAFAGAYGSVLFNAYNDLEVAGSEINREIPHYNSTDRRNSFSYGVLTGLGLNYKLPNARISADLRYCRNLKNITNESSRYQNSTLIYDFKYLDDDMALDYVSLNLGYHLYLNYRVKQ